MSIFAHCDAVRRIERCSSFSPGNFNGLPICFLRCSIWKLSVIQKSLQTPLFCDSIVSMKSTKTLRLRIKDKHAKVLAAMARDVNTTRNLQ